MGISHIQTHTTETDSSQILHSKNVQQKSRMFSQRIEPIRVTTMVRPLHIDLLVIQNQQRDDDYEHHFLAVKNFNR